MSQIDYQKFVGFNSSQYLPRKQYSIIREDRNKASEASLNDDEKKKFQQLVDALKGDFPEDVKDTFSVIRFLRARQGNVVEAEKLYRKRMDWVQKYKPHMLSESDVKKQIDMGKIFWYGFDKQSRPILIVRAGNHFPGTQTEDELYKFLVFIMELGYCILPPPPGDKVQIIYDRANFNLKNFDIKLFSKFSSLGDFYPETVYKFQILGANALFNILSKVAKKVMDPITAAKIHVLSTDGKKARDELAEMIPKHCLLPDHGGEVKYKMHIPSSTPESKTYSAAGEGKVEDDLTAEQQKQIELEASKQLQGSVEDLALD